MSINSGFVALTQSIVEMALKTASYMIGDSEEGSANTRKQVSNVCDEIGQKE